MCRRRRRLLSSLTDRLVAKKQYKKQTFNCQLILCEADAKIVKSRLVARFEASSDEEKARSLSFFDTTISIVFNIDKKAIRRNLGEMNDEYIARIDGRYRKLKDDNWFDLALATHEADVGATTDRLLTSIDAMRRRGDAPTFGKEHNGVLGD